MNLNDIGSQFIVIFIIINIDPVSEVFDSAIQLLTQKSLHSQQHFQLTLINKSIMYGAILNAANSITKVVMLKF